MKKHLLELSKCIGFYTHLFGSSIRFITALWITGTDSSKNSLMKQASKELVFFMKWKTMESCLTGRQKLAQQRKAGIMRHKNLFRDHKVLRIKSKLKFRTIGETEKVADIVQTKDTIQVDQI